jgi:hypothetical protein
MFGIFLVVKFTSQGLGFYELNKYFSRFLSTSKFELFHKLNVSANPMQGLFCFNNVTRNAINTIDKPIPKKLIKKC